MENENEEIDHPGYRCWRQFHGLCLDLPAPDAREIDGRLRIYQRAHEVAAMRDFSVALLLVGAIGRALLDGSRVFAGMASILDGLVFGLTCALLAVVGLQALLRLRQAMEQRALARGIGLDSLPWQKIESMFADTRSMEVREYLQSVRAQGRTARRAEVAVALERAQGRPPLEDTSLNGFARHVRNHEGALGRQIASALACLIALLLMSTGAVEGKLFLPAMVLFGGWALSGLLANLLQLVLDPWILSGGDGSCRPVRMLLAADMLPELAVVLAVIATSVRLAGGA